MEIRASKNNIQIIDSYEVSKYRFDFVLERIKNGFPTHPVVLYRTDKSIKKEWAVHNLLYKLGICKARTKHLDINYPLSIAEKITYFLFGRICLMLID